MSQKQEKKVVGRNVAVALGIICITVLVGLVGAIANYTSIISGKDNTIATKDSQIQTLTSQKNQLQTWLDGNLSQISSLNIQITNFQIQISTLDWQITTLQNQISILNSQISSLNAQIVSLQNQVNDLNDTVNLAKSTVWVNDQTISLPASSYTSWTCSASYAGYVSVWVQTSTTTNTYVRVIYTAYGVNYDQQIGVGTGGTAVFPLLPCSSIEIRVGNTNLINGATETVTITYYY
jgi:outer membrane murein-binding lipoprotein Lpp